MFNPDPIRGGKYVIQVKRYTNTVDVSAVRDLVAVVAHEGASRGILVTTSIMEEKGELETVKSKYFQHEQTKYLPRREAKLLGLNAQEIKHIDEVLARLGDKNAKELSDYSHKDILWIGTEDGKIIKYESVFYRTPETSVRIYDED